MTDGLDWLHRALAATDTAPSVLRGSALLATAALSRNSGRYADAAELGEACLAVYRALDNVTGTISAYGGLCVTALAQRDYAAAHRFGEQSRQLAEQTGDRLRLASALNNIGLAQRCQGRLDHAAKTFDDALIHWRAVGDVRGEAGSLGNLATIARRRGEHSESRQLCLESLRRYVDLDLTEGVLDMLAALACLDVARGEHTSGLRLLELCRREQVQLGAPVFIQDEIDDHLAARAEAEAALGPRAATIVAEAHRLRSAAVAAEIIRGVR
jgi:tetratricopeptide (TPR) repeat protein